MKRALSQVEIGFWDTAITLMSREKMPRIYTQSLASLTLKLQPVNTNKTRISPKNINRLDALRWLRLIIISLSGLALGLLWGWLSMNF